MLKKIKKYLAEPFLSELKFKIRILEIENAALIAQSENRKKTLNLSAEDTSPIDIEKRKDYIAKVAIFYKDIFEKKINEMVTYQYAALGDIDNNKEKDLIHKGTINALNLIDEWFRECVVEQSGYLSEKSTQEESSEDVKQRLKNKLK